MYDADERAFEGGQIVPKYRVGEIIAVAQSYKNAGLIPHSLVPKVDGSMIAVSNHKGWTNKSLLSLNLCRIKSA